MDLSRVSELRAEEPPAPDSWETADLDERVKVLSLNAAAKKDALWTAEKFMLDGVNKEQGTSLGAKLPSGGQHASEGRTSSEARQSGRVSQEDVDKVDAFLREALHNSRDRLTILRMEQEVEKFMRNPKQLVLEFQPMASSYYRLAAHRVAQHYFLMTQAAEGIDGEAGRIIARKTSESRFPAIRLADIPMPVAESNSMSDKLGLDKGGVKLAIKQRPKKAHHKGGASSSSGGAQANPAKTMEERKEEYNRARARIFSSDSLKSLGSSDEDSHSSRKSIGDRVDGEVSGFGEAGKEVEEGRGKSAESQQVTNSGQGTSRAEGIAEGSPGEREGVGRGGGGREGGSGYEEGGGRGRGGRVAILRDREKEKRDPDFNRHYDRYAQRFDQGFGVTGGSPYGVQPMYAPVVTYNTEFPTLGAHPAASLGMYGEGAQGGAGGTHRANPWPQAMAPLGAQYGGDPWGGAAMGMRGLPAMMPMFMPTFHQASQQQQQQQQQQMAFQLPQLGSGAVPFMTTDQYQAATMAQNQQLDMHHAQQAASRRR